MSSPPLRATFFAFVVAGATMSVGCTSYETSAREKFSADRSCPLEGVTASRIPRSKSYFTCSPGGKSNRKSCSAVSRPRF